MDNQKRFNQVVRDIKDIKIQGANNIAKSALLAYNSLLKTKKAKQQLINARPTEPLLVNVLNKVGKLTNKQILNHFKDVQEKINKSALKLIKNNSIIFTHCHSTAVVKAIIYAKKHGKKFQVYNTETRPLFQGRKTAAELKKAGIRVTIFVDSAMGLALRQAGIILLGADAILKTGAINKIGSNMIAELASKHKIPVYVLADSWKFAKNIKIEERDFREVWKSAPKSIKIRNPAFEKIEKKYIQGIISEFGVLSYDKFLRKVRV